MDRNEILDLVKSSGLERNDLHYLLDSIRKLLARSESTTSEKVESFLRSRDDLAGLQLVNVARHLCMSSRTLSRKLRREGTGFHQLLTREREQRCYASMEQGIRCGAMLTHLLGLSDISHFYKSFRKWSGVSFSVYKRSMAGKHRKYDMNPQRQS